ncbi:hypothetical protein D9M72_611650 [compost metagenome]
MLELLDGDDQPEMLAGQHITDRDQPAVRALLHLLEHREAGRLAPVRARERAAAEVVKDDLVVVAVDDGLEVVRGPGLRVALHDRQDLARGRGHRRAHRSLAFSSVFFIAAPPCAIMGST